MPLGKTSLHLAALMLLLPGMAMADPARIDSVKASKGGGAWSFSVTLTHGDTGWDDYADGWRVVDENGKVLGYRELLHPHVNEQPFTRSLSGVAIPEGMTRVFVEASTNVTGWDKARFPVDLGQ